MERLIDERLATTRKLRALRQAVTGADFLMERAAADLGDRLSTVGRSFGRAAAVHCLTPHAGDTLAASGKVAEIVRVEADAALLQGYGGQVSDGDDLRLGEGTFDLIVSLLTLHEANDLPGRLVQMRRALRPDGLLLACLPGAGTLAELRDSLIAAETELTGGAAARVLPFADVRDGGALLQRAGFTLPVADLEPVKVRYGDMFALLRDLRAMGATSPLADRPRRPAARGLFLRAAQLYAERHADADGRVRATFNLVWMSGWSPHASQQRPAQRGSATVSLADALRRAGCETG